jgi:hypothetical protein
MWVTDNTAYILFSDLWIFICHYIFPAAGSTHF